MPDPISTVIAIAAAGGAAGKLAERGLDAGLDWIRGYLGKHGDSVQERARANAAEFLVELANRVSQLEAQGSTEPGGGAELERRLSDPDFAATLQSALIGAARSSDPEQHTVLARLVAARLTSEEHDLLAVVSSLAVEAIPKLTRGHLAFLGLRFGVQELCIPYQLPVINAAADLEERLRGLQHRFQAAADLRPGDYMHLASTGCVVHGGGVISWGLDTILEQCSWDGFMPIRHLNDSPAGRWLRGIWSDGADRVGVTVLGQLIGVEVYTVRLESSA